MRSKIATLLIVVLFVTATASAPVSAALLEDRNKPDVPIQRFGDQNRPSFIVHLENDSDAAGSIQDWANASEKRSIKHLDNDSDMATVAAPRGHVMSGLVELFTTPLESRGYVEDVSPNYRLSYAEPVDELRTEEEYPKAETIGFASFNDPPRPTEGLAFKNDTNTTTMNESRQILGAENVSTNTSGMVIGVIDTGANVQNGQTFGNGSAGSHIRVRNISKNFVTGENVSAEGYDAIADGSDSLHGTWTAAALAANRSNETHDGLAPRADLLILKALADDGSGSTSDIARAIRYAAGDNPKNLTVDVLSMSLGSPVWDPAIARAVEYAVDQGVVVVVAAGNSRTARSPGIASPADHPEVITVGATNGSAPASAGSAPFSQVGPDPSTTDGEGLESKGAMVDVVAPGMKVTVKIPDQDGFASNVTLSGTSMSTPMVAGGIVLAMASNSTLADADPSTVLEAVRSSARPTPNLAVVEAGHGMFAADNLADGTTPEQSQEEAMTDPAQQRNEYYNAASDAAGGWLPLQVSTRQVGA